MCVVVFFFKQKTAYEMRISDWSSDVCSSDLLKPVPSKLAIARPQGMIVSKPVRAVRMPCGASCCGTLSRPYHRPAPMPAADPSAPDTCCPWAKSACESAIARELASAAELSRFFSRSEEHTSELQSLMRISYAVFC